MNYGSGEWWLLGADGANIYLVPKTGPTKVIGKDRFYERVKDLF